MDLRSRTGSPLSKAILWACLSSVVMAWAGGNHSFSLAADDDAAGNAAVGGGPVRQKVDAGGGSAESVGRERQKWALLVGVNQYNELRNLTYCRDDVDELGKRLVASGFPSSNVFLLTDKAKEPKYLPFKSNIERQLELVMNLAERDDLVLVAFSGHGTELGARAISARPRLASKTRRRPWSPWTWCTSGLKIARPAGS